MPVIFLCVSMPFCAFGESLLTAQSFPKTFNDLSFVDRMEILRTGYAPWESEYDSAGRCTKNCAYPGITIETELGVLQRNTDAAKVRAEMYRASHPEIYQTQKYPLEIQTVTVVSQLNQGDIRPYPGGGSQNNVIVSGGAESNRVCSPRSSKIPAGQSIPLGNPLLSYSRISSGYGTRIHPVTKQNQLHKGVDFATPVGTDVYAPADGIVDGVWSDSTCGRGLRIKHDDGFASMYCHLSDCSVRVGERVTSGCMVAKTGNTGRSTGPHLHYGIYYNNEFINPTEYINSGK